LEDTIVTTKYPDRAARVLAFQEFKAALPPLVAVLERYGLLASLRRLGAQLCGPCPICGGSKRSTKFVVHPERSVWKCFGHNAGGGTLEFCMAMENCDLREASERIARWFAIPPGTSHSQRKQQRSTAMSDGTKPTLKVFSSQKRGEGEKDWLTHIGNGWKFEFKDKKTGAMRTGINIQLSALPLGDRIVIFEVDPEEEEDDARSNGKRKK
jgi:hypothetical protein